MNNIFASNPTNDLFRQQGNNIFAGGSAHPPASTGYNPNPTTYNSTYNPPSQQPSWYNSNTTSSWRPGTTPTGTSTPTQQKLGTYRAPNYQTNQCPTNRLHKLWTNENFPVSICCLDSYVGLSPLELRIEDYYNIRTNNLTDNHRKGYNEAVAKKQFNDYIKNTNKQPPVPFTVNIQVGNAFPAATSTTNNNMFASRTGMNTTPFPANNSTTPNIFNQAQNNTNNIFTSRQQTNNNALFNQPNEMSAAMRMTNSTTTNIFQQNQPQPQSQQPNPFTSTPNIFQQNNTSQSNNLFAQNNMNQSQIRNPSTFPSNSQNLFAQNSNTNNLFAQNPSNNMFASTNNSNNLFANNGGNSMMQSQMSGNMFASSMGQQQPSMMGSNMFQQYPQQFSIGGGINLQTLFDLPNGVQQKDSSKVFSNVMSTNQMTRSQPVVPVTQPQNVNPFEAFMAGVMKLYQSVYTPQQSQPSSDFSKYESKASHYSESAKRTNWMNDDGFKYFEDRPKEQKVKIVFVDQQPHKEIIKPRFDSISDVDPYKERTTNLFSKTNKISPMKVIDQDIKRIPSIYSRPPPPPQQPQSNKTMVQIRCNSQHMQLQLELTSQPLQKIQQFLISRKLMRKYDTLSISNILVHPAPRIICVLTPRRLNLPPGYTSIPENPTTNKITGLQISNNHGRIKWQGEVDITGIDFSSVVVIKEDEVQIYEGSQKPPAGEGLNRPCTVTFFTCPLANQMRQKGVYSKEKVVKRLVSGCRKFDDCEFVSYDDINGFWTFRLMRLPENDD